MTFCLPARVTTLRKLFVPVCHDSWRLWNSLESGVLFLLSAVELQNVCCFKFYKCWLLPLNFVLLKSELMLKNKDHKIWNIVSCGGTLSRKLETIVLWAVSVYSFLNNKAKQSCIWKSGLTCQWVMLKLFSAKFYIVRALVCAGEVTFLYLSKYRQVSLILRTYGEDHLLNEK